MKASLGSEQYQSMNSEMALSYERFKLADVRLFKTADFDCSAKSVILPRSPNNSAFLVTYLVNLPTTGLERSRPCGGRFA